MTPGHISRINRQVVVVFLLACMGLGIACARIPLFSPKAMEGVDEYFDVGRWWRAPNQMVGRKVELGGQIIHAEIKNGETFLVVTHLPIVDQLVYQSLEIHRPIEKYGIAYRATIDPKWLIAGNHVIVVGTTAPVRPISLNGPQQTLPFITAECLHLWKSAGTAPPTFPLSAAATFDRLEQATYCASGY
jgi:starvation-inducible outer membrane lipoprotein